MPEDKTAAYAAVRNDPDVLLCEVVSALKGFAAQVRSAERHWSGGPFPLTGSMIADLVRRCSDPRLSDVPEDAREAAAIDRLRFSALDLADALGRGEAPSEMVKGLCGMLDDDDVAPYAPNAERWLDVRDKVWLSTGREPPPRESALGPAPGM
jgi:hypothetical protein